MKLGIFVGVPFGIVGMVSGYMTGSSRVGAISNLVPAALTLIGAVAAYLFTKGGKSAIMSAFAVVNFSILMLIGGYERLQNERIESSLEYQENELYKELLLQHERHALGLDDVTRHKKEPADQQ
jgi:predicted tellurium resistance membrane protein TerC